MKTKTIAYVGFFLIGGGFIVKNVLGLVQRLFDYTASDFMQGFLSGMSVVFLIAGVAFLGFYLGRTLEQRIKK